MINTDVLAVLPTFVQQSDAAPIRDAIIAALVVMFNGYEQAAKYAALQSDILYATGPFLVSKGKERGFSPFVDESEESFRARILGIQKLVSPNAICAAVDSIIAPFTCTYLEPDLDQVFIENGDATWGCFIGAAAQYQDRLYPDDAPVNGGVYLPNRNPGPAGYYDTQGGRYFEIQIPDLTGFDVSLNLAFNGQKINPNDIAVPELGGGIAPTVVDVYTGDEIASKYGGIGFYGYDNTVSTMIRQYAYQNVGANKLYDQIISVVERLRAATFRWALTVKTT